MPKTLTPARVRVRMYQVGFGDCFLLTFEYDEPTDDGRTERHVLIDYGSTRSAREGRAKSRMADVAALIAEHTGGHLDVLVLTHRHKDHLSGFGDDVGAKTLRALDPALVLRPWTEDPRIGETADGPGLAAGAELGAASARFAATLARAQESAGLMADRRGLHTDLKEAAFEQVKNADAIDLLDELSDHGRGRYLYAGADAGVSDVVPGVGVTVLGPPTVEQDERVTRQTDEDPEYWMAVLGASLDATVRPAGEDRPCKAGCDRIVRPGPGPVRWLVERLAGQKSHSATRLVRKLDDALNNTSLVLLLQVGQLSLLFPGDAQIENWQYTLDRLADDPELKARLAGIDLYKVGHHGSRNATPRSLHALWAARPAGAPALTALMSTRPGVHGESVATAVPRETLVTALQEVATLISTDDLDHEEPYAEVVAPSTGGPFQRVAV